MRQGCAPYAPRLCRLDTLAMPAGMRGRSASPQGPLGEGIAASFFKPKLAMHGRPYGDARRVPNGTVDFFTSLEKARRAEPKRYPGEARRAKPICHHLIYTRTREGEPLLCLKALLVVCLLGALWGLEAPAYPRA